MLKRLYIKDFALIDELEVQFSSGLNILTGETGTGKSIIIGALSLLLGDRASADVVRQGRDKAVIEGLFQRPVNIDGDDFQIDFDNSPDGLLLRREVHATGRSRAFANDSPISNTILSSIGDLLVDLHGQHQHQTLLHVQKHIDYLDNFGLSQQERESLSSTYKQYRSISNKLKSLRDQEIQLNEKRELLEFQVTEISNAQLQENEEDALELEERQLRNSEKLFQVAKQLEDVLYSGEGSVSEKLSFAQNTLSGMVNIDESIGKWVQACESARISIEDVAKSFQTYVSKIEYNPQRLEEVRERLGLFSHLKKKYGVSIEEVLSFYEQAKVSLGQIETVGDEIKELESQRLDHEKILVDLCQSISIKRQSATETLCHQTEIALKDLGLKGGIFRINLDRNEVQSGGLKIGAKRFAVTDQGIDTAEFLISLNPGEDPRPLAKIASGGEISRIMLALKSVLADADKMPVLVFDEIDTGISGRIARVVGKRLKDLANNHQVICITHLPQIASMGDAHFGVEKEVKDERSRTLIRRLTDDEKIVEIAKLLGGEEVTESTLQNARELLAQ